MLHSIVGISLSVLYLRVVELLFSILGQFPHSTRRRYQKRLPKRDPSAQSHRIEVHYTVLTPHTLQHQRVAFIYNRRVSHRRSK